MSAPRIRHSPFAIGEESDTNATLRGSAASSAKRSCGRSNEVVVSRLNWPSSGRSARIDDAMRADSPTARPSPNSGLSAGSGVSSPRHALALAFEHAAFQVTQAPRQLVMLVRALGLGLVGNRLVHRAEASRKHGGVSADSDRFTNVIVKSPRVVVPICITRGRAGR